MTQALHVPETMDAPVVASTSPAVLSPADLLATVHLLSDMARRAATQGPGALGDLAAPQREELVQLADQASRALVALRSAIYREMHATKSWQDKGDASLGAYAGRVTGTGPTGGHQQVAWAQTLGQLPELDRMLATGSISAEHVAVVTRVLAKGNHDIRLTALQSPAGSRILAMGRGLSAARFAPYVQQFATRADPPGADSDFEEARSRRFLRMSDRTDGVAGEFFLDQIAGRLLREALAAARHRPGKDDDRTSEQRSADALADIASLALNTGELKAGAAVRPHAIVLVHAEVPAIDSRDDGEQGTSSTDPGHPVGSGRRSPTESERRSPTDQLAPRRRAWRTSRASRERLAPVGPSSATDTSDQDAPALDLRGGPRMRADDRPGVTTTNPPTPSSAQRHAGRPGGCAVGLSPTGEPVTFTDGTPLPPVGAARLLCDAQWTRVVVSPVSQILDLGQSVRLFERELRKAIIARDQECRWEGCHRPAVWGEIHHIVPFENGGETSVHNGILLCSHHHHQVHRRDLRIAFTHHGVSITTPAGERLSYTAHPQTLRHQARGSPAA